jgi:hypothetical protein
MQYVIPQMIYLRRLNTQQSASEDGIVWVYWTYRNKIPSVLIAETRDKAKSLIRRLNPVACFFR